MSLRLCSHIKTNGLKCGSPALRHHTMCYFHYQWQRRDQRRIRLGGPVGMNKNTGIELPLLDGPEAILLSIMEIQRGLLDQRIEVKMGTALLYSLQLALQAKIPRVGLCASEAVRECPELDMELEMERARAMRPAKEKCAACPKRDDCLSPRNCRKLPKVRGYHRVDNHLVPNIPEPDGAVPELTTDASSQAEAIPTDSSSRAKHASACVVEGPASLPLDTTQPRHPERSSSASEMRNCGVEGPAFSPTEATVLDTTPIPETTTHSLRSSDHPILRSSDPSSVPPILGSSVVSRSSDHPILRSSDVTENGEQRTENPYAHNILGFKPNALLDLGANFPQLVETKPAEN